MPPYKDIFQDAIILNTRLACGSRSRKGVIALLHYSVEHFRKPGESSVYTWNLADASQNSALLIYRHVPASGNEVK